MANNMKPETMLMSGVTVDFPYTPYPCQIAMLARIIKALQQSKNCLLESPTGTGKTLTLICASLAWQQKEIEQFRMSTPFIENKDNATEAQTKPTPVSRIFYCTRTHKQLEQIAKQLNNTVYKDKIRMTLLSSRDNYCIHPIISKGPNKSHECAKITRHNHDRSVTQGVNSECGYYERLRGKVANDFLRPFAKPLPRVFDIEQFNNHCQNSHGVCPYYTSRLLINDVQLILCPYNYLIDPRVRNSMQVSITNAIIIIDEAHNIEDCARESMKFEVRKYDFEQALQELCTNQKVLDLAQIKIAELIVNESGFALTQEPLSSSHLTSSQRESTHRASGYSEYDELNDDTDLLDHLRIDQHGNQHETIPETNDKVTSEYADFANAVKFLAERFSRLILWFDEKDPREKYAFTPKQLIEQFHQAKFIDQSVVDVHKLAVKNRPAATRHRVVKDAVRVRKALSKGFLNKPDYVKFSDETVKFLEDFDLCLSILYADDYQFADEYKIVLKTIPFEPSASAIAQMQQRPQISTGDAEDNQWIDKRSQSSQFKRYQPNVTQTTYPIHTQQLIFYCLSPSVAFAKDLRLARSLIFASGTLAPLATYAGELKIPFDIQMECNHVIDLDRTFMTALSHGRNPNVKLRATYQNTDKIEFQDECGLIVLDVCQRVPYGVLCFLPSYRFLNVIMSRWMASGLWQKLNEHKAVFFEEKSSATFQNTMNRFREANGTLQIDKSLTAAAKRVKAMFKRKTVPSASSLADLQHVPVKGGLLLAVCRGRASEGIDFSDNNARCVITLGIPYPNVQDEEVVFKRNYNNEQNKRMPQVMNGSDWYDSQAYRALNQALGRCIRHKNDWGALVIVDERIVQNMSDKHFNNKISLWIKQRLCISRKYDDTMNALEKFVEHMQKSVEIERLKNEQKEQNQEAEKNLTQDEQNQNSEKKLSEEEQRRFAFAFPSIKELPKTIGENKPTHREWQITDLSDDESAKENQPSSIKQEAFGKYVAQRQLCMTPPSIPSQNNNETQKEKAIDPKTSSNHQNIRNRVQRHKKTPIKRFHSQRAVSTSSSPILPQKIDLFRTQKVIILSDDDDDDDDDDDGDGDFIKSKVCFHQPSKKVKTDKSFV